MKVFFWRRRWFIIMIMSDTTITIAIVSTIEKIGIIIMNLSLEEI